MLYIIYQVYKYDIYVLVETIFRNILKSSGNKRIILPPPVGFPLITQKR